MTLADLPGSDWSRISIDGKPVDIFNPPSPLPFGLIFLHPESGETPVVNSTFTAKLYKLRLRCVAPIAPHSWWVDRVCAEFDPQLTAERHILENIVPWMESNWRLSKRSIGVAGIEMGGQGAVRLGFKYPQQFPVVASINGTFDFQDRYGQGTALDTMYSSREQCRQDTAILHIPVHDWPAIWFACSPREKWYRGNDRLQEKLAAMGIPYTAELNAIQSEDLWIAPMLAFVVAALERESRRLT